MCGVGKIEDWNPEQTKITVVDLCVSTDIDRNFARSKFPLGMGKVAGSHHSVIYDKVVRTGFGDHFSGKDKGIGRGQNVLASSRGHADGPAHMLESARLRTEIVI